MGLVPFPDNCPWTIIYSCLKVTSLKSSQSLDLRLVGKKLKIIVNVIFCLIILKATSPLSFFGRKKIKNEMSGMFKYLNLKKKLKIQLLNVKDI
ncbi:hypothetical protein BpHYR1_052015 [Brachionus plicatilis]|uniref:Uncharacterized protein n=1 Tax=Brachionus plicatilis TaxID=10195 RepID=A0A3M7PLS2_BRAPC|nr:hypothetical protein BpHYR1_052015 [Brachionus plicatilis]